MKQTNPFETNVNAEQHIQNYYKQIEKKAEKQFNIATKAKEKGFDISKEVETLPTSDLADRTEAIIGPKGIAKRYREVLKQKKDRMETIFQIFEEILKQKWVKIPNEEKRIEQAIKTSVVLNTEGVVVAPIDGVPKIKISKNNDGSEYLDIYYAGPIRGAGGTSMVLPLILGDYARQFFNLSKFKPSEDEVERIVEECSAYEEIFSRQYKLTDEEVRKVVRGCPVSINGEPTEEKEVSVNRDIARVPHNRIRGGMCLVIAEGVAQKAKKVLSFAKMLDLDWSWLEDIITIEKQTGSQEIKANDKYLTGTAAGRPIFGYPSRAGSFRLRYGRTRGMGIMGKAIHPATMYALDEFAAIGTQLRVERPGKAASISACDSINGPIIRLKNGDVVKFDSAQKVIEEKNNFDKILFLGDMLVCYGDFKQSVEKLAPPGYNEEWWQKELQKSKAKGKLAEKVLENSDNLDAFEAVELSEKFKIPLHPKFTPFYSLLELQELKILEEYLKKAEKKEKNGKITGLKIEKNEEIKKILEKIGLEHKNLDKILIEEKMAFALLKTFGFIKGKKLDYEKENENILKILSNASGIMIRNTAGSFIGARMGRPEASTPRTMKGNPHVLFPIGNFGGNTRSITKAIDVINTNKKPLFVEVKNYFSEEDEKILPIPSHPVSKKRNVPLKKDKTEKLEVNLPWLFENASKNLAIKTPELVKGVRGLISEEKAAEPLEKGIIRAKHGVHVFKDGTIRYELINNPLTHFKPNETGTSIEKLKELGYEKDIFGNSLENDEQVVELLPQDIIVHHEAGDFMVKVSKFVDDLLERFYGLQKYYNAKTREDLIGELVLGLAPHTSAAIIGRIIGYSEGRACFAHPYFHQTKRRNADGDQDSVTLLMDGLINFSQSYLAESRGGRMDAPLVFTIALDPNEIDDEVYKMDVVWDYPLEFYEKALEFSPPELDFIETVNSRLNTKKQYSDFGFTHKVTRFDAGPTSSKYVQLDSMEEKISSQAALQVKIKAVEGKDSIEKVLINHFLPDIIGNARSFCKQKFRCTNCQAKYRRLPLTGKCSQCDKGNIILTIAQGSIRKYLPLTKQITKQYELSSYLKQRIDLIEEEIDSIFTNEKATQKSLSEFA